MSKSILTCDCSLYSTFTKILITHQMTRTMKLKSSCPKMSLSPVETKCSNFCKFSLDIHNHAYKQHCQIAQYPRFVPKLAQRYPNALYWLIYSIKPHVCLNRYKIFNHVCLLALLVPMSHTFPYWHPYISTFYGKDIHLSQYKFTFYSIMPFIVNNPLLRHIPTFYDINWPLTAHILLLQHIRFFTSTI